MINQMICSNALLNTFNKNPINRSDLINLEILSTLKALKILTVLKTEKEDLPP